MDMSPRQRPTLAPARRRLAWSSWAIANPIPVYLLFVLLSLAGAVSWFFLPVQRYPDITFPAVSISVPYPGASSSQIETSVTKPIEQAVASMPKVEVVVSTVAQGLSTTVVQFPIEEDLGDVTDNVRTRIDQIRASLPAGSDPPIVRQIGIDETPILAYAVTSPSRSIGDLSRLIDDQVTGSLQRLPGVGSVQRVGGTDREINVSVDPDRMAALGVSIAQLNEGLRRTSRDDPGGMANLGGSEQPLRIVNAADSIDELRSTRIPLPGGRSIRLDDVATIGDGSGDVRQFARLNGIPAVAFQIARARGSSEVAVEDEVRAEIAAIKQRYPDLTIEPLYSTVAQTRASLDETIRALLEGLVLTTIAVWFFLRDWRSTAVAAIAMPASLLPTLAVMLLFGFTLNIVSLLALTLVIGILVDDAIVEIENIRHRLDRGEDPVTAAREGANAIGLAVVATTLAIVVVFLPVSFMAGVPGRFFHEFGIMVSVAVLFSLLVARLLTPLLAARVLRPERDQTKKPSSAVARRYGRMLGYACARPWHVAGAGLAMMVLTAMVVPILSTGFQPAGDPDQIFVKIQGAPGSTARDMEGAIAEATALFRKQPEVASVFAQAGTKIQGGAGGDRGLADIRDATLTVVFRPDRSTSAQDFRARLRDDLKLLPDARVNFLGETAGADVLTILTGDDPELLARTANRVIAEMRGLKLVDDPRLTNPLGAPELVVRPDRDAMARLGVNADVLAAVLRVATVGDTDRNLAQLTQPDNAVAIRLRLPDDARQNLDTLRDLRVPTSTGVTSLGAVARIDFEMAPEKITRFDQKRQITIEADLKDGAEFGDAIAAIRSLPVMRNLPDGISTNSIGNQRAMEQLFQSLALVFMTAVVLMYALLVLLFGDMRRPVVILSALLPAVTGGLLALLAGDFALDLPALIGLLMLLGLAAKNSILIVDNAALREREGEPVAHAIIMACLERARPILMTSLAMIAGMVPTALAFGEGAEFRQPMAIAVIGGLISSTFVSLVLVPALYVLMSRGRKLASAPAEVPLAIPVP